MVRSYGVQIIMVNTVSGFENKYTYRSEFRVGSKIREFLCMRDIMNILS